jgi:hypothetical protein
MHWFEQAFLVILYRKTDRRGFCPTTTKKRAQNNAVITSQKEMDQVGFEPTTCSSKYVLSLLEERLL